MTAKFKKGDRVVRIDDPGRAIGVVGDPDLDQHPGWVPVLFWDKPDLKLWAPEALRHVIIDPAAAAPAALEYTGGSVSYYQVTIENPTTQPAPYTAECNDIIEALGMNYAEGNAFKAIWRACAARTLGKAKRGYTDALYDAEKVVFFGERMVAMAKAKKTYGVER